MHKKTIKFISLVFAVMLLYVGCKKDERAINLNLTAVPNLISPADNKFIKLKPAANLTETFEWMKANENNLKQILN